MHRPARPAPRAPRWSSARRRGRDPALVRRTAVTRRVGDVTLADGAGPRPGARPGDPAEQRAQRRQRRPASPRCAGCGSCSPATSSRRRRPRWRATWPGLRVDVLKVPHHGSRHQDLDWLASAAARGWPWCRSGRTTTTGTPPPTSSRRSPRPARSVWRTDLSGDVVVVRPGRRARCRRPRTRVGRTMARTPSAAQVLGHVVLVTGKEEYLSARTVASVRDAVRAHDAEAEIAESTAVRPDPGLARRDVGAVALLLDPVRRRARARGPARRVRRRPARLLRGAPADDVALVLVHSGGQKGSGVLTKLRKLSPVTEVKSEEVKRERADRLRDLRGRRRTARGSTPTPPPSWCRPSARTCARSPPRPTS